MRASFVDPPALRESGS